MHMRQHLALMSDQSKLIVFRLDSQRYAMPLAVVERVVRAVEVTALPQAPEIVMGVIDVEGRLLPVLNIRRKVGLADREIGPADQFLLARTTRRTVVLVIDEAHGVIELPTAAIIGPGRIVPDLEQIQGVIQLEDGLALIYDLERFLSLNEARTLDEAMRQEAANVN
jgi:purine-binding chemotaxis protein CheW